MHYLITGTAGFIGFHLARRLLKEGHSVTGFDGMTSYYDVGLKARRHAILAESERFNPVIGMLEDMEVLRRAADQHVPDIIVHLAAQAGVRYSIENPRAYMDSNIIGSFNVLEIARQVKPRHLMLASTSSVYGANSNSPFLEMDRADEPLTLYAASKKSMELMAHGYAHLHKVPTTSFRFFTVYGPWGRPDMALFKFVQAILQGDPIEIYGEGRMVRDFTYIDDLIEAVVRLIDRAPAEENRVTTANVGDTLSRQAPYRTINIGGGQPVGLLHFVDVVEQAVGIPAKRVMLPMQQGDVPATFAGADLLKQLTGYVPSTTAEEGVRAFVQWYRTEYT